MFEVSQTKQKPAAKSNKRTSFWHKRMSDASIT
jgi:hypothetical protein